MDLVFEFRSLWPEILLYGSPEVINALGDFMQGFYNNRYQGTESLLELSEIARILRKDLGLDNRDLGKKNSKIWKLYLTDYEKTIGERK